MTFAASGPPGYVPPGSLIWFCGTTPPSGYLICDGREVAQAEYPALFQIMGTTYGPAVGGNFTLPNLLGAFVRGWNNGGSGPDSGRIFGSYQNQTTAAPTVPVNLQTTTASAGTHQHPIYLGSVGYLGTQYNNQIEALGAPTSQQTSTGKQNSGTIQVRNPYSNADGSSPIGDAGAHVHSINASATLTGGDPETRPYNIALLPCVKW